VLKRVLSERECAVVVHRRRPPTLVRGPGEVWTFQRKRRVVVIDVGPLLLDAAEGNVPTGDGVPVTVELRIGARVTDPVDAAVKLADYRVATCQIVRTVARVVIRDVPHDRLADDRERIEGAIQAQSGQSMRGFGVAVSSVECAFLQPRV
jgi:regulator of protease activity HflC (stomatin/prohibitin superfamily)